MTATATKTAPKTYTAKVKVHAILRSGTAKNGNPYVVARARVGSKNPRSMITTLVGKFATGIAAGFEGAVVGRYDDNKFVGFGLPKAAAA